MTITPPQLGDAERWRGKRIGLLGGSFNPPHNGHRHIAKIAKARFGLDAVWWLVTPHNPLKDKNIIGPYDERFAAVERITAHEPAMMATHLERDLGGAYTFETMRGLREAFPETNFLWICGMDNALIFHKWERWRELLDLVPMTFIARPATLGLIKSCPLRKAAVPHHFSTKGRSTDLSAPGVFWLTSTRMVDLSSTKIRHKNKHLSHRTGANH